MKPSIIVKLLDISAIETACRQLGYHPPIIEAAPSDGGAASMVAIWLPEKRHPVLVDLATGEVAPDSHSVSHSDRRQWDRLLQAYAVEVVRRIGRQYGQETSERLLLNDSILVEIVLEEPDRSTTAPVYASGDAGVNGSPAEIFRNDSSAGVTQPAGLFEVRHR